MGMPKTVLDVLVEPRVIFDVGANRGRTVMDAHNEYPEAKIYAFEPVSATYDLLTQYVRGVKNVQTFKLALSESLGLAEMRAVPGGLYNKILRDHDVRPDQIEQVSVTSGDAFCHEHGIGHIDFMKIDTEGNDLNVLKGFRGMIAKREVGYIQVETGISADNKLHVRLQDLMDFFAEHSYGLVGLYEPVNRNPVKKAHQRGMFFCNSLFAAEDESVHEKNLALRRKRLDERQKRLAEGAVQKKPVIRSLLRRLI